MKLFEVKSTESYKGIPIVQIKTAPNLSSTNTRVKRIGKGSEATAFRSNTKPNTVFRISKIKHKGKPATLDFVAACLENQDNPFFPRIYKAKILRAKWDDYVAVEMEKLIPIDRLNIEDSALSLLKMLDIPHRPGEMEFDVKMYTAFDSVAGRKKMIDATQNPQLKEALQTLEPLFQQYGGDVHSQNIMIRLTSTGPQLVFSDPLHPDKDMESEWTW